METHALFWINLLILNTKCSLRFTRFGTFSPSFVLLLGRKISEIFLFFIIEAMKEAKKNQPVGDVNFKYSSCFLKHGWICMPDRYIGTRCVNKPKFACWREYWQHRVDSSVSKLSKNLLINQQQLDLPVFLNQPKRLLFLPLEVGHRFFYFFNALDERLIYVRVPFDQAWCLFK